MKTAKDRPGAFVAFERKGAPLLPRRQFYWRALATGLLGLGLLTAALGLGMLGYRTTEHMGWLDAYANAAMILSGMGPLAPMQTPAGKFFAGSYALFSGLAFITVTGLILSPFVHRLFHKFHLTESDRPEGQEQ